MGVYRKAPISERIAKTGKAPIGVRRVDANKGDRTSPLYEPRLVAKEFKNHKGDDLHAATPPIETLRTVISSATTGPREKGIMVNDVSRAYMYADCEGGVYVELCDEDRNEDCDKGMCGKLVKAMYGIRLAANMWQKEGPRRHWSTLVSSLVRRPFTTLAETPCHFCLVVTSFLQVLWKTSNGLEAFSSTNTP